jgi:MATE family multidrug resistance protein
MDATNLILSGALRGAGDTHFVMWYETSVAWLFFALGEAVIVLILHLNVLAAWGWALVYICLLATGMILRFRSTRWHSIELIERKEPLLEAAGGMPLP